MRLAGYLSEEQKQQLDRLRSQQKKPSNDQLTRKDWEELMGKNMDTYKRVRGAIRRS